MVLISHALSLPLETLDCRFRKQFFETVEALSNCAGLITQRHKQSNFHFLLILQKVFRAFQRFTVLPLQRRTNRNVRIEESRFANHCVDCEHASERMSRENAIRLNAILFLNLRNQLSLKELQKVIRSTTGRKLQLARRVFVGGLHRRKVPSTISVRDANYDQIRDTSI